MSLVNRLRNILRIKLLEKKVCKICFKAFLKETKTKNFLSIYNKKFKNSCFLFTVHEKTYKNQCGKNAIAPQFPWVR